MDFVKFFCCCERFEPRGHFKSRLSLIVRVNVILNRTVLLLTVTVNNNSPIQDSPIQGC